MQVSGKGKADTNGNTEAAARAIMQMVASQPGLPKEQVRRRRGFDCTQERGCSYQIGADVLRAHSPCHWDDLSFPRALPGALTFRMTCLATQGGGNRSLCLTVLAGEGGILPYHAKRSPHARGHLDQPHIHEPSAGWSAADGCVEES